MKEAYTSQGNPPTVTAMSSFVAVSRSVPVMVILVPPAAGPFAGWTATGLGSWTEKMITSGILTSHSEVKADVIHPSID